MPFLLIVFLALACLPDVGWDLASTLPTWGDIPRPAWIPPTWLSALLTWSSVFFMVAWAWNLTRQVRQALAADPAGRSQALHRYEVGRHRHSIGLYVAYIVALCLFGWGWAVGAFWTVTVTDVAGTDKHAWVWVLPLAELLVLIPFLAAMILSWVCFYDADRAAYLTAHPLALDPLARALLDQDVPLSPSTAEGPPILGGRWSYVLFKVRHTLVLVFIPLSLLLVQKELFRRCGDLLNAWGNLVLLLDFAAVGLGILAVMPWVIRLVLGLKPMPEGPLRRRLVEAARRLKFRHSDILVWNTHGGMANAMMLGILPWPRYVVFTDRLLEEFTPEEVLAVFGHEIGHSKHHHMLYYLTFLTTSLIVLSLLVSVLVNPAGQEGAAHASVDTVSFFDLQSHPYLRGAPMMALVLGYIFVVFGFLSRRCERQADVFGCRAVSCGEPNCLGHDGVLVRDVRPLQPCPTGIGIFIQALDKVAALNGINREKPGFLDPWQHSTIARRVAFLRRLASDPALEPRFQRGVFLVKCGLLAVLGLVLVLLTWTGSLQKLLVNF